MLLNLDGWARRMFTLYRDTAALGPWMSRIIMWLQCLSRVFEIEFIRQLPSGPQDTVLRLQLAPIATLTKVCCDADAIQVRGEACR